MMRLAKFFVAVCLVSLTGAIQLAPSGSASAEPEYHTWTGRVQRISDGDTMRVNIDGRGLTAIRLIGINAFELGECSADIATDKLESLAADRRLTLEVPRGAEADKYGRYPAYATLSSGVDLGAALLKAGAVWPITKNFGRETTALEYYRLAQAAQSAEVGIWNSSACGAPPTPGAELDIRILRNPDGRDDDDPNKEWVKIVNEGTGSVNLSGWRVRSSGEEKFTFPAGTKIAPGDWLKLHAGNGSNSTRHLYWGLGRTMYSNTHPESIVLTDRLGNLRHWKQTPCPENCGDVLRGKVELRVSYDAPGGDSTNPNGEWVDILNTSASRIDLEDYVLINDQHRFIPGGAAKLDPGERMRVRIGSGVTSRLEKFWGKTTSILANKGDDVVLRSMDGVRIAAISWPCDACGQALPDVNIVFANPDAPGVDDNNLHEEYVVLRNDSGSNVDLTDWALRNGTNWYRFGGDILPPGHEIRLVTAHGRDRTVGTTLWRFWDSPTGVLPNFTGNVQLIGPNLGVADCYGWGGDPCERPERRRSLSVSVQADPQGSDTNNANGETIRLKNRESSTIDLSGFRVVHNGHVYVIRDDTRLVPGAAVTIHAGVGRSSRHHQYWGTGGGILANDGGVVYVYDPDGFRARRRSFD